MSLIVGSFSSISSGPRPKVSSSTSLDQPLALVAVQQRVFGVAEVLDDQADLAAQRVAFQLAHPRQVELVDELAVDALLELLEVALFRVGGSQRRRQFRHDSAIDVLKCRCRTSARRIDPVKDSLRGGEGRKPSWKRKAESRKRKGEGEGGRATYPEPRSFGPQLSALQRGCADYADRKGLGAMPTLAVGM